MQHAIKIANQIGEKITEFYNKHGLTPSYIELHPDIYNMLSDHYIFSVKAVQLFPNNT